VDKKKILDMDPENERATGNMAYYEEDLTRLELDKPKKEKDLPPVVYTTIYDTTDNYNKPAVKKDKKKKKKKAKKTEGSEKPKDESGEKKKKKKTKKKATPKKDEL